MNTYPFRHNLLTSLLKVFYKYFYTKFAWTYDWVADVVSFGKWKEWVFTVLPYLNGERILELGHGPGHLLIAAGQKGINMIGLDVSKQMGGLVLKKFSEFGVKNVCVNGYAQLLPFPNQAFDQVVATFPSDYIFHQDTLSEVWRVLVPNGNLIVLPFAMRSSRSWFARLSTFLFKLSTVSSDWQSVYLDPMRRQGFDVQMETIHKASSKIFILNASKPAGVA